METVKQQYLDRVNAMQRLMTDALNSNDTVIKEQGLQLQKMVYQASEVLYIGPSKIPLAKYFLTLESAQRGICRVISKGCAL